jgi:hypothetical protein
MFSISMTHYEIDTTKYKHLNIDNELYNSRG